MTKSTPIPYFLLTFLWLIGYPAFTQSLSITTLPLYSPEQLRAKNDWLVAATAQTSAIYRTKSGELALSNGLITRTFSLAPNGATLGLDNLVTSESLLRSVSPEAVLWINGIELPVGGLLDQPIQNYLSAGWTKQLTANPSSLQLQSYAVRPIKKRMEWNRRTTWSSQRVDWPPKGLELVFTYGATPATVASLQAKHPGTNLDFLTGLVVQIHYELYDGLPLLSKWVTIETSSDRPFTLDNIKTEHLAVTEAESAVERKSRWELPPIFAQSDFAFQSMSPNASENACVDWVADSTYQTQVNYLLKTPSVLVCQPRQGVGQAIKRGQPFESMRLWELLYDSWDRERRGLAQRKMYRTIAPWVTENPMIMHIRSSADADVKKAVDQCAEVGFELAILTFGSGFNLEDSTRQNVQRMKALKDYAMAKGVAIGGYSLLASRTIDAKNDVVMPKPGMTPTFGHSPCLESDWGHRYFSNLYRFYEQTGMDVLEHDGSYPGDVCAATDHPGHTGFGDSQWKQFVRIRDFYQWCRQKGIYLNVPDWYFLAGSNKVAMGYRETNWSLPREYQEIIERQNIYDGTWEKTPSMGWMFVPLVEYHGGGAAATIEPLKDHLPHYEQRMANLFGAGVQACYRGPQLYDAPETKVMVQKWVNFYKKHRPVLDADIIHLRRPDGRDYDAILHVDPQGPEKGLLMVYNPLDESITRTLTIDLYYTGLKNRASVSKQDGRPQVQVLDGTKLTLPITIPAKSQVWYVFN